MREVPLLDLKRLDPELEDELQDAFTRVLKSGYFILGPEVEALEEECASYCEAEHAIGVSSGTDALLVALMALGIGAGDEVICPSFTFFATAGCISRTGARPVFVDALESSFNCDPEDIERKITSRTRAIIPVHLYGRCADMAEILDIAERHDIAVIEDAAQAIGAEYEDRRAGSMGRIGCFSFFPTKNLGACGDGGLVTCQDAELADKIRVLRVHGSAPKYHHGVIGGNFRLDALQAALIRPRLRRLDDSSLRRARHAAAYNRLFEEAGFTGGTSPPLRLPETPPGRHIYNQYTLRCSDPDSRDALREFLAANKIATEIYYPIPLHLQKCFSSLNGRKGDFPISEKLAGEVLSIPIFAELEEEEISHVADRIAAFFKES
ncbi:MAG: DegT/DnrJ/EryC1/StrS family aminotransferase [Planctomycetota bacterium]|nr:DegT/DnrJ/EryC1/StrS family aminotransferase [Planctomycetota bacterium]MEE3055308.1 DegT/DnrJ/EryC1/StrS family aminotransferase [Planctomycetota bacterium]